MPKWLIGIFLCVSFIFSATGVLAEEKSESIDSDSDGLSDIMEEAFHTDTANQDSDGDGYFDGLEVQNGYNPNEGAGAKLPKKIDIYLKDQTLRYSLGDVVLGSMKISSGIPRLPTPKGKFRILNKSPRAWSKLAHLWMPYWMAFAAGGKIGLHELPEWPGGKKEGADHLGKPASHGCVRLGVGAAKKLYEWTPIGTPVEVH